MSKSNNLETGTNILLFARLIIVGLGIGIIVYPNPIQENGYFISFIEGFLCSGGAVMTGIGVYKHWLEKRLRRQLQKYR